MKEIYQILCGSLGQEMRMAQIANNLANVNTAGFKGDSAAFVDYYEKSLIDSGMDPAQAAAASAANPAVPRWTVLGTGFADLNPGPMRQTGRPLDAAIDGEGFFQVQVEGKDTPCLTRAGNFRVNESGTLVTLDNRPVLDDSGRPITLPLNGAEPVITPEGDIMVGGAKTARIGVYTVDDPRKLEKYGDGLLSVPASLKPRAVDKPTVRQGMLEGSNVNPIMEMIRMIEVQRAYATQQKLMQTIDEAVQSRIDMANR